MADPDARFLPRSLHHTPILQGRITVSRGQPQPGIAARRKEQFGIHALVELFYVRASRARAKGDYVTWLRDESSRTAAAMAAAQSAAPAGDRPVAPVAPVAAVPRQLDARDRVPHNK